MLYRLFRFDRWALLALAALLALLAVGCRGGGKDASLVDVALSSGDVPADWVSADFGQEDGRDLWKILPELLTVDSEAHLFIRAFQEEDGRHGVATILIETEEAAALPQIGEDEQSLGPLARLLEQQDVLLSPIVLGGDPGTYFAATNAPVPGSLRSRLVRLLDEGLLFSDSVIFVAGPVLAVVTVWYPEKDDPLRDVDDLAGEVERRLQAYLDG